MVVLFFRWVFTCNFRVCLKLDGSFHEFSSLRRENPFRITINKWDDGKCQTSAAPTAENRWNTPNLRKNRCSRLSSCPFSLQTHYLYSIFLPSSLPTNNRLFFYTHLTIKLLEFNNFFGPHKYIFFSTILLKLAARLNFLDFF